MLTSKTDKAEQLARDYRRGWTPPPRISIPEWADRYRKLAKEAGSTSGNWRTNTVEVARGPMLAVTEPGIHIITVMVSTQMLKALDIATPIPTPNGWTTMGELRPGNVVLDETGAPTKVVAISGHMQGKRCFEVVFSDGATIVADADHLWVVDDNAGRNVSQVRRVIDTAEMSTTFKHGGRNRYAIPVAGAMKLPERDLPIPPYALGAWLGDGTSSRAGLTLHRDDFELIEHLRSLGLVCDVLNDRNGTLTVRIDRNRDADVCRRGHDMRVLGRTGGKYAGYCSECTRQGARRRLGIGMRDEIKREHESIGRSLIALGLKRAKSIPAEYLRASEEQRLELLRGLMDTDGTISKVGRCMFSTTLPRLRDDVLELLRSLGFKPSVYEVIARCKYKGRVSESLSFQISFTAYAERPVFRLARKVARLNAVGDGRPSETFRRRIVDVRPVATRTVQCITADSPNSMYLCGRNMVPTHNTALLENIFGYFAHLDACPILLIQPKDDAAEQFSKERIAPLIRSTPVLRAIMGPSKSRDRDDTLGYKAFPGGFLALVSAGSPDNLARRPIRVILADEIDKYPPLKEGDSIFIAEERTASFGVNWLSVRACSPTYSGESRIEKSYNDSDQRRASVSCPHCGHRQFLDFFKHVHWEKERDAQGNTLAHNAKTARVVCECCGATWSEGERLRSLSTARWHQTRPFECCGHRHVPLAAYDIAWQEADEDSVDKVWTWSESDRHAVYYAHCPNCGKQGFSSEHAGFQASKLYSPWSKDKPSDIAKKWIDAQGDEEQLQAWWNTQMGLPYRRHVGKGLSPDVLLARCEKWPAHVPTGVGVITVGVDIQPDRGEFETVGWGRNEESWSIDHHVIEGDPETPVFWERVDAYLKRTWHRYDGMPFEVMAVCIDSGGHNTQKVYEFAKARLGRRIWAIKGASERAGARSPVWPTKRPSNRNKANFKPVVIGTNAAKDVIYARLRYEEPGAGYMHFPADRDIGYFTQLTSEISVLKSSGGRRYRVWELPAGKANEALDCRVYAYTALCGLMHFGLKLNRKVEELVTPLKYDGQVWSPADPDPQPTQTEKLDSGSVVIKSKSQTKKRSISSRLPK